MAYSDFEAVIGIEIHVQLLTKTKMFCACSTEFGEADNENTCPTCIGLPGALPVLNSKAVELGVKTGLALNCKISTQSVFARKNYFYPDLPKGYQISQYEAPLCEKGHLEFYVKEQKKRVGITRAHLEEDAGKSTHQGDYTLVNLNRAATPLLEIVSEPDLRTPQEAAEYARAIHAIVLYAGVCDGNLEEGSLRCDCNVSVRRKGETKLGTKVELKNINSFRFVEKAIEHEIERQIDCIESGEKIIQETRLYDPDKNRTYSMRTKEEAQDYRYFPDPDLLTLRVEEELISKAKQSLPELPIARAERFQTEYKLPAYDSFVLTGTRALAEYYENVVRVCRNPKAASNWVMVELLRELNNAKVEVDNARVTAEKLGKLICMIDEGTISGKIAKDVFVEMFSSGGEAEKIVAAKGLGQISDESALKKIIVEIVQKNQKQKEEYKGGKEKVFGFFVGQAMKATKGQGNPELINKLLKEELLR